MSSFYEDMITYYKEQNNPDDIIYYPHTEDYFLPFFRYGNFLDSIPTENRREEIINLFEKLNIYVCNTTSYNHAYGTDKREDKEKQKKINVAKKFREQLGEYPFIKEQYERIRKNNSKSSSPLIELIALTDMYIEDLSNSTNFSIFKNKLPTPKPTKKLISAHLTEVAKKYGLKKYSDSIIEIEKNLKPSSL